MLDFLHCKCGGKLISILALMVFCFFVGYGVGISDPEPTKTRELEKQIKAEELKKLQLNNEAMEKALRGGEEIEEVEE